MQADVQPQPPHLTRRNHPLCSRQEARRGDCSGQGCLQLPCMAGRVRRGPPPASRAQAGWAPVWGAVSGGGGAGEVRAARPAQSLTAHTAGRTFSASTAAKAGAASSITAVAVAATAFFRLGFCCCRRGGGGAARIARQPVPRMPPPRVAGRARRRCDQPSLLFPARLSARSACMRPPGRHTPPPGRAPQAAAPDGHSGAAADLSDNMLRQCSSAANGPPASPEAGRLAPGAGLRALQHPERGQGGLTWAWAFTLMRAVGRVASMVLAGVGSGVASWRVRSVFV